MSCKVSFAIDRCSKSILFHAVGKGLLLGWVSWWKTISTFLIRNSGEIYCIHKQRNSNSKNTVYLIECNQFWKQYTGSSKTKFRYRASNYKSTHFNLDKNQVPKEALMQKIFLEHFCSDDHSGIQVNFFDWTSWWRKIS